MSQDLFEFIHQNPGSPAQHEPSQQAPLAHRIRPQQLEDFFGQTRVLGPDKPLRKWIQTDQVPSLIFWGPPGCGKTTLAKIIAQKTRSHFKTLSAVMAGVKDIKEEVERAKRLRDLHGKKTILFVDEIHRFNKSQQDALLPHVEDGTVTLIGATTENPSFELNRAILSRARVIRFDSLEAVDVKKIITRALEDEKNGLNRMFKLSDDAVDWLSHASDGDARRALSMLEQVGIYAAQLLSSTSGQTLEINAEAAKKALESALERQPIAYDKSGEEHYNVISAFIKSIRDSDPDAALYYLARMIEGGEDPLFIARRLVILASEDIGNADPRALSVAVSAQQAVDFIGMPEGRIPLAQATTYLAVAPKSNASYIGIDAALAEVHRSGSLAVPFHLRNAVTSLMKNEGYGKGYQYAHDHQNQKTTMMNLPKEIANLKFYEPKNVGFEKIIQEKLEGLRKSKASASPSSNNTEPNR